MRLLTDREDGVSPYVSEDFQEQYEASVLKPICQSPSRTNRIRYPEESGAVAGVTRRGHNREGCWALG